MDEGAVSNICIGGTFSPLHKGHTILLREAFKRGKRVSIGLTSDKMARRSREREVLPYYVRLKDLKKVLEELSMEYGVEFSIREIHDRLGFAVNEGMDSIVVSKETEQTVDDIDIERSRRCLKPLRRFVIDMVLDEKGDKISSTRVATGEIDIRGRSISDVKDAGTANKVCIHLGSKNPDKVRGAVKAFRRYWPEVQIFQYNVGERDVNPGHDGPIEGARMRTEEVRRRIDSQAVRISDHLVGIESGLIETNGTWFMVHCCHISYQRGKGTRT